MLKTDIDGRKKNINTVCDSRCLISSAGKIGRGSILNETLFNLFTLSSVYFHYWEKQLFP